MQSYRTTQRKKGRGRGVIAIELFPINLFSSASFIVSSLSDCDIHVDKQTCVKACSLFTILFSAVF